MRYLFGTDAQTTNWSNALNTADGLPRRGVVVGGPDGLPLAYSAGAAGWTTSLCTPYATKDSQTRMDVTDYAVRYLGTGSLPVGYTQCILIVGQSNGANLKAPDLSAYGVCVVNAAEGGTYASEWVSTNPGNWYWQAVRWVGEMTVREVWDCHGEADALLLADSNAYQAKKVAQYAAMRARWGANLTIRSTILHSGGERPGKDVIRAAQQAIAAAEANTYEFSLESWTLAADKVHYGAPYSTQYIQMGVALGAEFVATL